MNGGKEFSVIVKRQVVVAPLLPMQEKFLPLSNLDLLIPPIEFSVFLCYKKHNTLSFSVMVNILEEGLAQVLEPYYILSGEVVLNSDGEPQLLCSNRGVDFVEAYADVVLDHLQLYNPDASVEGKLVPKKKEGVLCIQVTELKCGALVVACTFDHRIADAYSANMFLISWAEASRVKPISLHPSFERSFLNPHQLTYFDYASLDSMYVPISSMLRMPPTTPSHSQLASRIYYVTAEHISGIQSQANINGNISKLESFSAYLWQILAKGAHEKAEICSMGIVVDGRTRIASKTEGTSINYFGNVVSIPFGVLGINELKTKPLAWIAKAVHKYLEVAMTKEHFLGLIDWVEAHRPDSALSRIYCMKSNDELSFVMSSGLHFSLSKVDFGSGNPIFGCYHFPWKGEAGYVMPMPSPRGNGDWVVYMHLTKEQLNFVEAEVGDVFRPLTVEYLNYS